MIVRMICRWTESQRGAATEEAKITERLAHTVVFVTVVQCVSTDPLQPIGVLVGVLLVRPGQSVTIGGHEVIVYVT